jgi:putative phosphonate metabolism protein
MSARYAIYWAPAPTSPWWVWGARWLGRDEILDQPLPQDDVPGFSAEELHSATAVARRYGCHATLKPPFHLADGAEVQALWQATHALAATVAPVALGPVQLTELEGFLALTCERAPEALMALAARCVVEFDGLRAPLSEADRARRRVDRLDARGRELVQRYGYDRVLERFVWHVTLSDRLQPDRLAMLLSHLEPEVARLNATSPLVLDRLSLFVEPTPGAALRRLDDVLLAGVKE